MCGLILGMCLGTMQLEAHYTEVPPRIDGKIEQVWLTGDSVTGFTQLRPDEGEPATEPTTVYILYDEANLYVAFRCETPKRDPITRLSGDRDGVRFYLDTFHDKTVAYLFWVAASGQYADGIILDDGRSTDWAWEGVWFSSVGIYPEYYVVEMKIPFKSIRYKRGLETWGINFQRWIYDTKETVYWAPVSQEEGLRVSKFGEMRNIKPRKRGLHLEIFPVGFVRYEEYEKKSTYTSGGIDIAWEPTPELKLLVTANPDFAHIEADPYTLNLSRYEIRLAERRPFFVEGSEHFRASSLPGGGFYSPISLFYSRRVGKRLRTGEEVPISFGAKFIGKARRYQFGSLFAKTSEKGDEPSAMWGALRYSHKIFKNSSIGLLYGGKETKNKHSRAIGCDIALRTERCQFLGQIVGSDANRKRGYGLNMGIRGLVGDFAFMGGGQFLHDSLDIGDIGFMNALPGESQLFFLAGPQRFHKRGLLRHSFYGLGGGIGKAPGEQNWSSVIAASLNLNFRNNWGFSLNSNIGKAYEVDTSYVLKHCYLSIWSGGGRRWNFSLGGNYGYSWNYRRAWLAWQGSGWLWTSYSLSPNISISTSFNTWVEFDPENSLYAVTSSIIPRARIDFTKDISFTLHSNLGPITKKNSISLDSYRIGGLFSWRIAPKSRIYIAFNDYREREGQTLKQTESIGVIKIRYLYSL